MTLSACEARSPPNAWPGFRCRGVFVFSEHWGLLGKEGRGKAAILLLGAAGVPWQAFSLQPATWLIAVKIWGGGWVAFLGWRISVVAPKSWPLRMDFWFLLEEPKGPFDTRYGAEISRWPSDTRILFYFKECPLSEVSSQENKWLAL